MIILPEDISKEGTLNEFRNGNNEPLNETQNDAQHVINPTDEPPPSYSPPSYSVRDSSQIPGTPSEAPPPRPPMPSPSPSLSSRQKLLNKRIQAERAALPKPTNYISLKKNSNLMKGEWVIDTSINIPAALLPRLKPEELRDGGRRKNLSLENTNSLITADVWLVRTRGPKPTGPHDEKKDGAALLHVKNTNGWIKFHLRDYPSAHTRRHSRTPIRLSLSCTNGSVDLSLPRSFRGAIVTSSTNGTTRYSDGLQSQISWQGEEDSGPCSRKAKVFVGPLVNDDDGVGEEIGGGGEGVWSDDNEDDDGYETTSDYTVKGGTAGSTSSSVSTESSIDFDGSEAGSEASSGSNTPAGSKSQDKEEEADDGDEAEVTDEVTIDTRNGGIRIAFVDEPEADCFADIWNYKGWGKTHHKDHRGGWDYAMGVTADVLANTDFLGNARGGGRRRGRGGRAGPGVGRGGEGFFSRVFPFF